MAHEITAAMVDAIKVQFLQPIFEDDFPERGMKAWLTKVVWAEQEFCYKLYFDFTEFEAENLKYFTQSYYHSNPEKYGDRLLTAIEAGYYNAKYDVYFSASNEDVRDDQLFAQTIKSFLQVVE